MRSIVNRARTIATLIGALGLAFLMSGVAVTIGGSIWAVMVGIPVSIAAMAGFCTLVMTIYLAMAPMMYRALKQVSSKQEPQTEKIEPNYTAWRHVQSFTLVQAAMLWCEREPKASALGQETGSWFEALKGAIRSGELQMEEPNNHERRWPSYNTRVTRSALRTFAQAHSYDPRFLRDS